MTALRMSNSGLQRFTVVTMLLAVLLLALMVACLLFGSVDIEPNVIFSILMLILTFLYLIKIDA